MQHVPRFTLALLFAAALAGAAWGKSEVKASEYKRSDPSFYWKGDVLRADPGAVILTKDSYTEKDGSYFFTPKKSAPKEVYVQVVNDWVEPITPPDMPASLGVPPDQMQIREPQGDVQVSLPAAPATFSPATDGMTIPNGAVVKTGANGTAAVLMGGVNSARLIPNSLASIQQTVTADSRTTEIDLTSGAVFSKVGKRMGEKQDYKVHTPFGVAAARGTDFVTVAMPARVDVWIAAGTVQLDQLDGAPVGTVKSEGTGALKIIRFPLMPDPHAAMMASSQTMTAALDFIPMVNLKIKALRAKMANGVALTPTEKDYLGRIKEVPCLIKLALVVPPAPVVVPPPPPPAPVVLNPIDLNVREDGKVDFQGATLTVADLKTKLSDLGKTTPDQPIVIKPATLAEHKTVKKIQEFCHTAKLKKISVDTTIADKAAADKAAADKVAADKAAADKIAAKAAADKAAADKKAADKAAADKAKADKLAAQKAAADKAAQEKAAAKAMADQAAADKATAAKAAADKAAAEAKLPPIELGVHADGKVDFQGSSLSLNDLKLMLEDLGRKTPGQPLVVVKKEKLGKGQLRKVVEIAHAAKLTSVTVSKAPPPPAVPPAPAPAIVPPAPAAVPVTPPVPVKQLPPAMELPLNLEIRPDGKVDFQSATLTLNELKVKLEDLAKATPDQALVIKPQEKVGRRQVRKVVSLCHSAMFRNVTVVRNESQPGLMATTEIALAPLPPPSTNAPSDIAPAEKNTPKSNATSPASSMPAAPVSTAPADTVP